MELLLGVFTWLVVGVAARVAAHHGRPARDPRFEAMCAARPVVVAFRVQPGRLGACARALWPLVRFGRTWVNWEGDTPWPLYRVRLRVHALDARTLCLRVRRAQLAVAGDPGPVLARELARLPQLPRLVEEVWLSGQWSLIAQALDRDRVGFVGRFGSDGQLHFEPLLDRPGWLVEASPGRPGGAYR